MKRQEIDACIDQIIAFSECEEFIDTPVKRYSSGMYVKLAFAVAAHLNSELLLMDEVLAVGDMHFQKKCLDKMTQLSNDEQKTILYVSHNMETIRTLCIVLEKGHLVFDGEPEEAIAKYLGDVVQMKLHYTYEADANDRRTTGKMQFTSLDIKKSNQVMAKEGIGFSVAFRVQEAIADLHLRCTQALQKENMWQSWRPWNRWAAEDSGGMPGWNMPLRLRLQKMHLDSTA